MLHLTPILIALGAGLLMYQIGIRRTARTLDANSTELADPGLQPVLDRLARALELPRLRVHIYEIPAVNGLAAPDGRVFLTRGFFNRYRTGEVSAEEIASVVAHELGHVALGHSRRRMVDFTGQNAIRMALAMVLGRVLPGIGVLVANAVAGLIAAGLSRSDEYEADAYAAALMSKAGLGVGPQIKLLQKLGAMSGVGGGPPTWLASHPATDGRVAAIRRLDAGWQAAGPAA